ncbi:MAG: geranylgeranyl reductase family protein [Chloroflexi bacterium]|nr:geranylgeranyl reductase family protein [Chloroflexota bacterium]
MHDVVVVGAGPAGSVAAAVLAREGLQVLLLDKAQFPRDKPCGDGVGSNSLRLLAELGLSLESKVQGITCCSGIRAFSSKGDVFEGHFPQLNGSHRHGYIVPRREFDHVLREFALQQGARFECLRVTGPIVEDGTVHGVLSTQDGRIVTHQARITIAADGANSVMAEFLHPKKLPPRYYGIAMRAYFDGVHDLDQYVELYFDQTALPGYGWLFPIGNGMANVGIGLRLDVARRNRSHLLQAFDEFVNDPRLVGRLSHATLMGRANGWLLPFASQRRPRACAGMMLVGDAGAFVSPLTGSGIYNAMETGRIAAQIAAKAIQANDCSLNELRKYEVKWQEVLGKRFRTEATLQMLLGWPGILDLLIRQMKRSEKLASFVLDVL